MVLCVRDDINMSIGKKCAQCAHAAVGCFQKSMEVSPTVLIEWESQGAKKVVVKINGMNDIATIKETCNELGIINYEVVDAGRTELTPGTSTVIGVGPAPSMLIDAVTGHFKLL